MGIPCAVACAHPACCDVRRSRFAWLQSNRYGRLSAWAKSDAVEVRPATQCGEGNRRVGIKEHNRKSRSWERR